MSEKPKYRLQDLIDIEQFQSLQDRLNEIYSFPSAIIDNEGNILTATAWQEVCTRFHRVNLECEKDCLKSDQYILSHLDEAKPAVSYRCPRGLVDNATPIIIDGVHYGNFFTGQFFFEPPDLELFRAQAQKYGFDEESYLEAVKKVPVWSQKQLESYLFFIRGLIEVISSSGLKRLKEIEARKQIEAMEERAGAILNQTLDGFWITDRKDGRIVDANNAMGSMLGYTREELLEMAVADVEAVDSPEDIRRRIQQIVRDGSTHFESRFRRKDGVVIDVEVSVNYLASMDLIFGFHRDITERKQTENSLRRLNRELRAISDCNQALVRAEDEQTLLNDICRIVCDEAGYRMAWVGFAENDEEKTVRPAAWAGVEDGYVVNARISWADTERGSGPTGVAIRTGKGIYIQDFVTDPSVALWRENALRRGYRSSIALPLKDENGQPFGALMIYSTEPNSFNPDEIRLLEELAGDLAFGVTVLRARAEHRRMEEALEERNRYIETIMENAPIGFAARTTDDGMAKFVSSKFEEICGVPHGAITSLERFYHHVFLDPVLREQIRARATEDIASGNPTRLRWENIRIQTGSGEIRYITVTDIPLPSQNLSVSTVQDVTERVRAEKALHRSEAKFRAVIDNSSDGILFGDANAVISYRSPSYDRINGYSDEERIGRSGLETAHPNDLEALRTYWAEVVQNPGVPFKIEYRTRHKNGSWVWVETTCQNLINNPDIGEIVATTRDITERKLAEEALHAAKTRLETIINVSPLAIISLDVENKVQLWNPAAERIFGWRADEVLGRPLPIVLPSRQDEHTHLSEQVLSGRSLMNHETVRLRKDGSLVDVSLSSAITYDSSGKIDGRMAILTDITERKRAAANLAHSHDLMRYIIEHNRSAVAVHDKEMNYVYVSQRYLDDYNVKEKDVIGKHHYEVFPDLPQKWRDVHQRVLKGEVLSAEDDIFERADGSVEWTRWECRPWYEVDGSIGGLIVYTEVITERKRAEEAIRRFNRQLASAVDTGRSLAASLNRQLIYEALHNGLQRMFPDVATVFISCFDAERKVITAVHGSQDGELVDVARLPEIPLPPPGQETQSQVIQSQKPLLVKTRLQEKPLNSSKVMVGHYDGRLTQSALYVPMLTQDEVLGVVQLQSYHPNRFTEEDTRVLSLIANTAAVSIQNAQLYETAQIEIMERKQAEEALRTSEEQYRRLINTLPSGVVVHSQGQIELVNRAGTRFFGASDPDQLIGTRLVDRIHPSFRDVVHERIQQTQEDGQEAELMEEKLLRLDGTVFDAEVAAISVNYAGKPSTLAVFNEITERKQRERELHTIAALSAALRTAPNRTEMLPVIVEQTVGLLSCDSATIEIVEPETGWVTVEAAYGEWASLKGSRQEPGSGINAIISQTLEPFYSHDMENDPSPFFNKWASKGVRGCAGIPLIAQEKLIGFIWMGRKTDIAENDIELLSAIADIAANAIHRATLHEQTQKDAAELAQAYDTTLEGWARALDLRDQETVGHTRRVVERTLELARAMGVDEHILENIRRGALLHDIGKMGIPDSVLLKPGTLNEREWEIMQRHPEYAFNLLRQIEYLHPALDIPYCHHEKWDGTGYPRGLKGEEIPLAARIFAVVDVWDALTNDRPYRPAWSEENALKYIQQEKGKHFDPAVVEAFLHVIPRDTTDPND